MSNGLSMTAELLLNFKNNGDMQVTGVENCVQISDFWQQTD